ncbi:MAG: CBS domain-containing protein [Anaerolineae bacterium]|nr:CBS domain-containing protein [Anaerolineae bacterium]
MTQRHLVRDLMTVGVLTCTPDATVAEIARLLLEHDLEGVIVLDHEGHAVGTVTQHELIGAYQHEAPRALTAAAIMREDVPELPPDIPLIAAAGLMRDQGWRVVFLMHNATGISYPAAQLSYRHFLRHLAARSDADLADLGIRARRQSPMEIYAQKRDAARRQRLGAAARDAARRERP